MVRPPLGLRASTYLSLAALFIASSSAASTPASQSAQPSVRVVHNVRLDPAEDAPRMALVLRNGRIEAIVPAGEESLVGAVATDGKGALVVPAFIDAYSQAGLELPEPVVDLDRPVSTSSDVRVDMRSANRKGIRPALRAAELAELESSDAEALRKAGFGATLVAPAGELLAGSSALLATRDAALRDALIEPDVFQHATFTAQGSGFPSTLMGYLSQLRQFFLDAEHHALLGERYAAGAADPRPPVDRDLEAILPVLAGERVLVCRADNARDIERWLALGDEAGFRVAISGGGEAWKLADLLAERDIPVFMTLAWGEEVEDPNEEQAAEEVAEEVAEEAEESEAAEESAPETEEAAEAGADEESAEAEEEPSWIYTEPLGVRAERRRLWLEGRDCALRLNEAGVDFAFGSGTDSADDLLDRVRDLVAAGLPREVALSGLTANAARLLGVEDHLGALEVGQDASFALWTADPLVEGSKLAWLFIDGHPHEFDVKQAEREPPDEGLDATGTWAFEIENDDEKQPAVVVLKMNKEGDVTGTLTRDNPMGEGDVEVALEGHLSGSKLSLEGVLEIGDMKIELDLSGELTQDTFEGQTLVRGPWGEETNATEATRTPEAAQGDERTEVSR